MYNLILVIHKTNAPNLHPTATIHRGANLDADVEVGPYAVIGEYVTIGKGSVVMAHANIGGHTTLGRNCRVFPFASIGMQSQDLKYTGGITYVEIGTGTILREYVTINSGTADGEVTRVGNECLIMAYAHVAHGCSVGNEVILSNGVQLAGETIVEPMAIISGMTGIHQFTRIGTMSMVGACTLITKDVPPYMLVADHPARIYGLNAVGLQRRAVSAVAQKALKESYRLIYRSGLNRTQAVEKIRTTIADCPEIRHLCNFIEQSARGTL